MKNNDEKTKKNKKNSSKEPFLSFLPISFEAAHKTRLADRIFA